MAGNATGNGSRSRQRAAVKGCQRSKLVNPRRGPSKLEEEWVLGQFQPRQCLWGMWASSKKEKRRKEKRESNNRKVDLARLVFLCLSRLDLVFVLVLFLYLVSFPSFFAALFYDFLNKQTNFYGIPIWANKRASTTRGRPGLIGTLALCSSRSGQA